VEVWCLAVSLIFRPYSRSDLERLNCTVDCSSHRAYMYMYSTRADYRPTIGLKVSLSTDFHFGYAGA